MPTKAHPTEAVVTEELPRSRGKAAVELRTLSAPSTVAELLADVLTELREIRAAMSSGAPEGLDAQAAGQLLGISRAKVHELNNSGLIPSPSEIGVGRCPRWSRGELVAWLRAGAPSRARWQLMRDTQMRRVG